MALKLEKEYAGVVYSPRREEIYSNGGDIDSWFTITPNDLYDRLTILQEHR